MISCWPRHVVTTTLALGLAGLIGLGVAAGAEPAQGPSFERDVLPIFRAHCLKCHGGAKPKLGLDLGTPGTIERGSRNGPVLVKGKANESPLFEQVLDQTMPPGKDKLSQAETATIRAWIDGGAPAAAPSAPAAAAVDAAVSEADRDYWAFRPLARPAVPVVRDRARLRTPIDAFVLAKLEARGLGYSPEAGPVALVRRASFDLLGLPPAPEEVQAFLADRAPDAYERLIDRLLASPHYGERWGRHWLDAVGYVDTVGTDNDAGIIRVRDGAWRYRDYVVRSLNTDKPYDRFLTEQLAGDELVDWRNAARYTPEIRDALIATGLLRTAVDNTTEDELNRPLQRFQVLHGTIENLTSGLLGLTVACARCHDHKFDPIPQRDYYRLMAVFTPAYNPSVWIQPQNRHLWDVSPAEKAAIDRENAELDRQIAEQNGRLAALRRPYAARLLEAKLGTLPAPIRTDVKMALETQPKHRTPVQKYLAEKLGPLVKIDPGEVTAALTAADAARAESITAEMAALKGRKRSYGKIQALYDLGPPPPTYLLRRGDEEKPGAEVAAGFLSVLCATPAEAIVPAPPPGAGPTSEPGRGSGRRTALARWLTNRDSPAAALAARVLVNRLWQHHFGTGIVATSENFGAMGTPPSHPELLEWLAADLVAGGWRLKRLHKLILTSSVYRQASYSTGRSDPEPESVDPGNTLLWRKPLRRLEAEAIRDAFLAISGHLDPTLGGPPVPIETKPDGMVVVAATGLPNPAAQWRRSLYLLSRRNYGLSLLTVFDAPIMASNCPRRTDSVVPLQALSLINSAFAWDEAEHFAERVARSEPGSPRRQIERAFRMALARPPTGEEAAWSLALLETQVRNGLKNDTKHGPRRAEIVALTDLCLMLLNTNEFLYVE